MFKNKEHIFSHYSLIILIVAFCIIEFIIYPSGNFPLNDEWWYARFVKDLQETGIVDYTQWGNPSVIAHLLFGKLIVTLFDFSYTILHLSTLLFSFLGIIFFYKLCKEFLLKNQFTSFLVTLVLIANPLFISLSNSFMTDVPFIATLIMGLYGYLKYKSSQHKLYLALTVVVFSWCILIRQLALAFVLGIFITQLVRDRKKCLSEIILLVISLLSLFVFEHWLHSKQVGNGYTYLFYHTGFSGSGITSSDFLINVSKRWVHYISFTGFVLFPLLIPKLIHFFLKKEFIYKRTISFITSLLMIPVTWSLQNFPIGNYLYDMGVGPETLYDTYIANINKTHSTSFLFFIIKGLSFMGSYTLLFTLIENSLIIWKQRKENKSSPITIILISLCFYYLLLANTSTIFDRYILVFSLFIIPFIVYYQTSFLKYKILIVCLSMLLLVFSILTTKDYYHSHQTRWEAIYYLKDKLNVSDEDINGGLEHESKEFFERGYAWVKKWQNNPENKFALTHGFLPNYHQLCNFTYQRFIPFKKDTIFVYQKNE